MMRVARRFLTSLLSRPQLISPAAGAAVVHALLPGARLDGMPMPMPEHDMPASPNMPKPRQHDMAGDMAVIGVIGELVHRGSAMDADSGLTSYQAIDDMISSAFADPAVSAIVLDVDSPGGEASGVLELAAKIGVMAKSKTKPMCSVINSCACSAAYALASATGHVAIAPTGIAGSIGVVAYHADVSKAMSDRGVDVTYIYAGARKIDGVQTQPLSDPARARLQANVDMIYAAFCSQVADARGMTPDAVKATEAGVYMGQEAVDAGLADCIATIEETIMAMSSRTAEPGARIQLASQPNPVVVGDVANLPALPDASASAPAPVVFATSFTPAAFVAPAQMTLGETAADPQEVARACTDANFPALIVGLLGSGAAMSAVNARIAEMREIASDLTRMGLPSLLPLVMKQGMGRDAAREMAFAAKAAAGDAMAISTANDGAPASSSRQPPDATAIYNRFNTRNNVRT